MIDGRYVGEEKYRGEEDDVGINFNLGLNESDLPNIPYLTYSTLALIKLKNKSSVWNLTEVSTWDK